MKATRFLVFSILAFLCLAQVGTAQLRPDLAPQITSPVATDAFYTQERGSLYKIRLDTLRRYLGVDIQSTQKGYTPGSDAIPDTDRFSIIQGDDGNWYYIDRDKAYVQLAGSSGASATWVTLAASGETSMKLRYIGASAPTLTKDATGQYRLNIPSGTEVLSANWTCNNTHLSGGSIKLTVDSAAGSELYAAVTIIALSNNDVSNLPALGIVIDQTLAAAGEVAITLPNVSGYGVSGFRVLLRF